jgi:Xaa-Pro aminopeptidase
MPWPHSGTPAGTQVALDFVGVLDGYCGDLARVATVGQMQANARTLANPVRVAQEERRELLIA